jgi:hypothetical protein
MSDRADAELIFRKNGRVQRDFSPIGKGIAAFHANGLHSAATIEPFELPLDRDSKAMGQPHFDFLGEKIVRKAMTKNVAFVNLAEIEMPRRQNVSRRGRRKARSGKSTGSAISAVDIISCHDDLGSRVLGANGLTECEKSQTRESHEESPGGSTGKWCQSHIFLLGGSAKSEERTMVTKL